MEYLIVKSSNSKDLIRPINLILTISPMFNTQKCGDQFAIGLDITVQRLSNTKTWHNTQTATDNDDVGVCVVLFY